MRAVYTNVKYALNPEGVTSMIEKFIELYAAAFLSFTPNYISDVYEFPMTFYAESGDTVSFDKEPFVENAKKLILGLDLAYVSAMDSLKSACTMHLD